MKKLALCFVLLLPTVMLPSLATAQDVDKGRTMGNASAPLLFEVYSDFMCPACKLMHEKSLPQIVNDYVKTGKAYLVFREFPLNIPQHMYSRQAAAIAVAAGRIGRYQAVSDALFMGQPAWITNGRYWETAASVLTPDEQKKVLALSKDPEVVAAVQRDVERGTASRIAQTPTIIVTYKLRQQPWTQFGDYSLFRGYIDGLLKK